MIYNKKYEEMAAKIDPFALTQYLSETGWEFFKVKRDDIAVYQYKNDSIFEQATIPLDRQLCDFAYAMYDAARSIAIIEGKSDEQVLLMFLNRN